MTFDEVVEALRSERIYQLRRWGVRQPDGSMVEAEHGVADWLVYIQHYLTKAFREASEKDGNDDAMEMLRKVTAMSVAACEQNGVPSRDPSQPVINGRDGISS